MAVSILEKSPAEAREGFHREDLATLFDDSPVREISVKSESEDPNILIARFLKENKTRLIKVLAQSALTPPWILKVYEQQLYKESTEVDEEVEISKEISSSLGVINQRYREVMLRGIGSPSAENNEIKELQAAIQWFPFTFKDLTQLVDLHCFVCRKEQTRDETLSQQTVFNHRRGAKNSILFEEILELHQKYFKQPGFLFMDDQSRVQFITDLLASEAQWLKSRQKLVTANSGLVLYIANQYKGAFLEFDDLVQEGQTGLLKAVDRYDPRLGFKFSTYAGYWIRQAISRSLSRCERVVRIPCGQVGTINKFYRIKEHLLAQTGKEPSLSDLAEHTGLSSDEIDTILAISQTAVPIEASTEDEEDTFAPIDYLEQSIFEHPFGIIAKSDLDQLIERAIKILSPREAQIICYHFGVDYGQEMTLKEIGMELNLTRERVRQIEVAALNKMKRHYGPQLSNFL